MGLILRDMIIEILQFTNTERHLCLRILGLFTSLYNEHVPFSGLLSKHTQQCNVVMYLFSYYFT